MIPYRGSSRVTLLLVATGNLANCAAFWRTFVRNSIAITWIEEGYRLLWTTVVSTRKKTFNAPLAIEHSAFASGAVAEMLAAGAVALLPRGEKPMVVSPWGWSRSLTLTSIG